MIKEHLRFKFVICIFCNVIYSITYTIPYILLVNISNKKNQVLGDFVKKVKEGGGWSAEEFNSSMPSFLNYGATVACSLQYFLSISEACSYEASDRLKALK